MNTLLSFLIPCYNSQDTVEEVINEIIEVVGTKKDFYDYEIIAINDGSPDGVLSVLRKLAAENPKIKVIDFALNRGKHAALMAGFNYASGEIAIAVDDDMQCPVNKLWDLLEPIEKKGYDVSTSWYAEKKESLFKRIGSKVNEFISAKLLNKPQGIVFSRFTARKKFVYKEMVKYKHPYPSLEGLTVRVTHNICMVPMEDRERIRGKSGYNFIKSLKLMLNGCTTFSVKPLRISSVIGFIFGAAGFIYEIIIVIRKILNPSIQAGYSSLLAVNLMLGGIMLIMMGIMGEYIGRMYLCINQSPQFVIRETINLDSPENEKEHEE